MTRVLLTGATGFVGRAILPRLIAQGCEVRAVSRHPMPPQAGLDAVQLDLATASDAALAAIVQDIDAVIHAAGYAHAMKDADAGEHARVNHAATQRLALALAQNGRKQARFVFLSSIKARLGEARGVIIDESMFVQPLDPYGRAKQAAEEAIRAALPDRHVILQPVLVCDEGAKGNLASLLKLAALPLPLPFASLTAKRSLISREDLADLASFAALEGAYAGQTLIAADPEPTDLAAIIRLMRQGMGRKPGLFPFPPAPLFSALRLCGRGEIVERLSQPVLVRPAALLAQGWRPRVPVVEALAAMGAAQARNRE